MESAIARLEGREFQYLMKKKRITIGRSSGVDINMGPSRFISRKHLDVLIDSGVFYLVCRGKNGIFVDDLFQGREAKRTQLPLSCVIRFPSTQIKLAFTSLIEAPATPSPVMTPPPMFPLKLDTMRSPFVSPFVSPAPSPTGTISAVNSCPASPSGKVPSFDVMVRYASSLLSNQPTHPAIAEEGEVDANNHPAVIGMTNHEVSHDDARGSHDETRESHDDTMEDKDSDDDVDGGADKKPPYSYAQLIVQALLSAADHKQTLSGIYEFISRNYPFYKIEDKGWKNSIRHNLSLNQYFTKAPRQPMAGKGGYWSMHPDFEEKLIAQAYTKRKKKGIPVFPANSLISKSAPSSPTHHAGVASHDYSIGRDSPQPHASRMVMLPATYSLPSSPSRNHRPLKFTHLTLGASTGSLQLQRFDTGEDPPASKKLCLDTSTVPSEDNIHHPRPGKLFGTSSTALLTAMHRSMATRETPTMPNVNLGSKLKDIQQPPVTNNGSLKSSPAAVQMVPISLVSSNQGHMYVNIPPGVFSQSQQPSVTAVMSTQGLLAPQAFIPMATIQQEVSNGSHDPDKESCDDEIPSEEQECDHTSHDDATVQSPETSNGSPDASVGSPDHDALPGSPDHDVLPGSPDPAANGD